MIRRAIFAIAGLSFTVAPGWAVEGGSGAYLLGTRDLMAGVVPPPGTYIVNDFNYINGSAPVLSIGGAVVVEPEIDAMIYKLSGTEIFKGEFLGGSFGMNVTVPVARADLKADAILGKTRRLTDDQLGVGDITVSPILGWHHGKLHTSATFSFYLPTGQYSTAEIKPLQGVYDVLSIGKNKFAFDPTVAMTYLDPETGFELSGALGVTINATNTATEYLTAPELHFEMASGLHLPNGLVLGATGYVYQQLANDSGAGARNFQRAVDAQSLQARVLGVGPVIQYYTALGEVPLTFEGKFIQEFGAKRRLESELFWFTVGAAF